MNIDNHLFKLHYQVRWNKKAQTRASQIVEFGHKNLPALEFPLQNGRNNF